MSLSDLKKSKDTKDRKTDKKNFTVDEFISDAEDYALGKPKVVSHEELNLEQAVIIAKQRAAEKPWPKPKDKAVKCSKRHATFTLSEDAISQLELLAKESKLAKSHIIRILIDELCNEEQKKKLDLLLKSKVE